MNILEQVLKEQEDKKKKDEPAKCPLCGGEVEDNTFMHGSRTAGSMQCKNKDCGYFIMF